MSVLFFKCSRTLSRWPSRAERRKPALASDQKRKPKIIIRIQNRNRFVSMSQSTCKSALRDWSIEFTKHNQKIRTLAQRVGNAQVSQCQSFRRDVVSSQQRDWKRGYGDKNHQTVERTTKPVTSCHDSFSQGDNQYHRLTKLITLPRTQQNL